jgi:DNA polymerase
MNPIWRHVSVDIETYSDIDIKKAGLYKYAQSPAFDILLIAYAVDAGPVRIVDLTIDQGANGSGASWQALQDFLALLRANDCIFHAYNAAFEHYCINTWCQRKGYDLGLAIGDWRCTMAHGLYCGYPAGLAATGEAMGLPQDKQKMGIGAALIRKFCVPGKEKAAPLIDGLLAAEEDTLTKVRRRIAAEPEKWKLFKEYCKQDVEAEREIERRLSKWRMPAREQLLWELTVEANIEGVGVDRELVDGALYLDKAEQAALLDEAQRISGLDNPKSVQQLLKWLSKELDTDEVTDLKKATVSDLLKAGVDSDKAQRMLELRQLMSKTSTKKYDALQAAVCDDGRVRGMMFYYGANRSGRWAGRIVQPQNLPQNHLPELDQARQLVKKLDAEMLKVCYGPVPDTLSQLIRTAFIPRPGKIYAVADYSAIEARVVAWLAGETWVLDAFRAGKDIYCATASQMFGVPVEKHGVNSELRQRGKVATLALGYGGGESALVAMGALKMGIPEEDLPEIKAKWRQANPAICALWRKIEDAAILCVRTGERQAVPVKIHDSARARENEYKTGATMGTYSDYFNTGVGITFRREADFDTNQDFLTIELPTRRKLFYAHPQLLPARNFPDRESLHYLSTNQTTKKWGLTDTWGGKLVENVTQAVARDCLAETLLRLRHKGMIAVFHVHDEVIVEVDREDDLQTILDIMAQPLDWAPGLPLKGAGFCADYYQKD